jgi:hypothetical protein
VDLQAHPICREPESQTTQLKIVVSPVRVRVSPSRNPPWLLVILVSGECHRDSDRRPNLGLNWAWPPEKPGRQAGRRAENQHGHWDFGSVRPEATTMAVVESLEQSVTARAPCPPADGPAADRRPSPERGRRPRAPLQGRTAVSRAHAPSAACPQLGERCAGWPRLVDSPDGAEATRAKSVG